MSTQAVSTSPTQAAERVDIPSSIFTARDFLESGEGAEKIPSAFYEALAQGGRYALKNLLDLVASVISNNPSFEEKTLIDRLFLLVIQRLSFEERFPLQDYFDAQIRALYTRW